MSDHEKSFIETKIFNFDRDEIQKICEDFFTLYTDTFDEIKKQVGDMCELKKIHTREVADNSIRIAGDMGLSDYDTDIAWIIGELHDFARFGQAAVTNSLDDSDEYQHAQQGVRLLFDCGLIEDIIHDYDKMCDEDKIVIKKAIYYHSDYQLPDDLTERERMFCKIIREADQLDIFRVIAETDWGVTYGCSPGELLKTDISAPIEEAFYNRRMAEYSKRVTPADFHMAHVAICFGLESESARKRAVQQGYIMKMLDIEFSDPDVQKRFLKMKKQVEDFLNIN